MRSLTAAQWVLATLAATSIVACETEPNTLDATVTGTSQPDGTSRPDGTTTQDVGGDGTNPIEFPPSILCPAANEPRCGLPFDPANAMSNGALQDALDDGLKLWRKQGTGGACASCHSPDGIEIAKVGFNDDDIERRALEHLTQADADGLKTYIAALRQKNGYTQLLHPDRFRPLQPGAEALGPVDDVIDPDQQVARDTAFMNQLEDELKLTWARTKIESLEMAQQAYDEIRDLDMSTLKLGIPFDRLSEDAAHGEQHKSVYEWFPGIPSEPRSGFYELVDDYLEDPSDKNLWKYFDAIDSRTSCAGDLGDGTPPEFQSACDWMRHKWKALQLVAHQLRTGRMPDIRADVAGGDPWDALPKLNKRQPIWMGGDHLRQSPLMRPTATACFSSDARPCTLLPPAIDETVSSLPSYEQARIVQSRTFQQSWFVMAWLFDPALLHQGEDFSAFIGDYLEATLLQNYDIHHAFVVMRTAVMKSAAKDWVDAPGFRNGTGKIASVRTFSFKQLRNNFSPPPEGDPRRRTHDRMFANFARMWIYLIDNDLRKSGEIYDREETMRAVRFMRTWLQTLEGREDNDINVIVQGIESRADDVTELRSDANKAELPGMGLQPNGTWRDFDVPYQLPD